jgi:3-dehydrosphinganine reductase
MGRAWSAEGKIVLVTGGSSGIGLAAARLLSAGGAHVWLLARTEDRLNRALAEVQACSRASGQRFGAIPADVSDEQQVREAITRVSAAVGLPDLVINSAGITYPGYVQDLELSIFRSMMEVNYFGTVYVTKAVLPGMLLRGSGYIVNIASLAGLIGVFGYTAYGASKFAVRGFTDALRAEVKPFGIGVSIVYPPDTDTPQLAYENQFKPAETKALSSMNSVLPPETVAKAILDGVARRRYVILPGFESKLTYWLVSIAGTLTYPAVDWLIARAQREMRVKEPV